MRTRTVSTTVTPSDPIAYDAHAGTSGPYVGGNAPYSGFVSTMSDDPTGGNRVTKPCLHVGYSAVCVPWDNYDSGDMSSAPSPNLKFVGRVGFPYGQHLPPVDLSGAEDYIHVTEDSTDDLENCVFHAYNQFINGVRALDASESIMDSGETPRLFEIWQRRKGVPSNIVSGFLGYSFGWRPLLRDLRAVASELRRLPLTVRKRLKAIGKGVTVRHFMFHLDHTVDDLASVLAHGEGVPYFWNAYHREWRTTEKSRLVVVTIRANVKPKLGGSGQVLLDKLGALGLIPSLATVWKITRLSFVVDWFYNIGGAIENLQGCLTHDIHVLDVCVSEKRTRTIVLSFEGLTGLPSDVSTEYQTYYRRFKHGGVPFLPQVVIPRRPMTYVLLALLSLTHTKAGAIVLQKIDGTKVSKRISAEITKGLDKVAPLHGKIVKNVLNDTIKFFFGGGKPRLRQSK